eukprot:c22143_g1_i1.p1 GENE.c22143_g1_i1~~c22143_g1_i1.p1  ORF type:complete len:124 (-),score=39.04 c22143_g1_i1:143-481(-)
MTNNEVDRCGYMTKLGGVVKNWKTRWFVLSGSVLTYYKSKDDTSSPAGTIDLKNCKTVKVCMDNIGKAHTLEVSVPGRNYFLSCDDDDTMNEWLGAISRAVIRNTKGMNWDE